MVSAGLSLEDELGDVLEKALRCAGLTESTLAERAQVDVPRIRDAIDYRSELTCDELRRIASALGLNEVGLCALGAGRYPLPEIPGLPFNLHPLRMAHGIGVANAYLVTEDGRGQNHALLFDAGADFPALRRNWPAAVKRIDAVFLTHVEAEHAGGLCEALTAFDASHAFVPDGATAPCAEPLAEGAQRIFGGLEVTAFSTPGHCAAHNCYLVRSRTAREGAALLISGDLLFAGSVGGGYFCHRQLSAQLRRIVDAVPPETVVAPGHGPLTTIRNERKFNPFVV